MQAILAIALLGGSAALGLFLGWQYLRRRRNKPLLIGLHLILGGAGLESIVMLRGSTDAVIPALGLANAGVLLMFTAMMTGLITPLIAQKRPRRIGSIALAVHASVGALGFVLFLVWAATI
jgi:hypothetical protein